MHFASCLADIDFWNSYFGIWASIVSIAGAGITTLAWLYNRRPTRTRAIKAKRAIVKVACNAYAEKISDWFSERIKILEEFAKRADLRVNDKLHSEALSALLARINDFPGGFYTIDENGIIIDHLVPKHPKMNIRGNDVSGRDYFLEVVRLHRPVVSDAVKSKDRPVTILVVAVPRYNDSGRFVGILDGVIDIDSSSLSDFATSAAKSVEVNEKLNGRVFLYFVDRRGIILGTNSSPTVIGDSVYAFVPQAKRGPEGPTFSEGIGEHQHIAGISFSVIAIWKDRET